MHLRVKNDERQMPERRTSDPEHVTLWMGRCGVGSDGHVAQRAGSASRQTLQGGNWEHIIIAIIIFLPLCSPLFVLLITWRVDKANKIELAYQAGEQKITHTPPAGASPRDVPPGYGPHCHCSSDFR